MSIALGPTMEAVALHFRVKGRLMEFLGEKVGPTLVFFRFFPFLEDNVLTRIDCSLR